MSERYTELMDAAQEQQDKTNQMHIARAQALAAPELDPSFDGVHCVDGGEEIPEARLALGKIRCVSCQTALERTRR
jgi:RNA polymerase-binding transcription factor DksA